MSLAARLDSNDEAPTNEAPRADNDNATVTVITMSADELRRRREVVRQSVTRAHEALPGLVLLPRTAREGSRGHLREGEATALRSIFATAHAHPALCESLAASEDRASRRFDALDQVDQLDRADLLVEAAGWFRDMAQRCEDTALDIRAGVRETGSRAYPVLRAVADFDRNVQTSLQPALDFYGAIGRKAARTRAANDEAPAVDVPATPRDE